MAKYAGGTILEGAVEFNDLQIEPAVISITLDKINTAIGTNISSSRSSRYFHRFKI